MDSILKMLSSLSINNKKWLADKLYEEVSSKEKTCELDKAIEAAHNQPLKKVSTVDELMADLLTWVILLHILRFLRSRLNDALNGD